MNKMNVNFSLLYEAKNQLQMDFKPKWERQKQNENKNSFITCNLGGFFKTRCKSIDTLDQNGKII